MTPLAILAGIIALLLVPVVLVFEIARTDSVSGKLTIGWMFGLVLVRIDLPGRAKSKSASSEAVAKSKSGGGRKILGLVRQTAFRRRLLQFAGDLVDAIRVTRLDARIRLGLGDPAETGRLWALIWPLNAVALRHGLDIRFCPDFVEPVFELEAHGRIVMIPLQFIALMIAFLLSPTSLRAWRHLRSGTA